MEKIQAMLDLLHDQLSEARETLTTLTEIIEVSCERADTKCSQCPYFQVCGLLYEIFTAIDMQQRRLVEFI